MGPRTGVRRRAGNPVEMANRFLVACRWGGRSCSRQGEIEAGAVDPKAGEFLVLFNRGSRIVLGMVKGFYPGYDREISEVYRYKMTPYSAK